MPKPAKIKICGIKDVPALNAAVHAGAHYVGFVFFEKSPRYIAPPQAAHLVRQLPSTVKAVGLFVDPTDAYLEAALGATTLDVIQLHGHETPERVAEIKATWHMPVIKALPISTPDDLQQVSAYENIADWILFDAKPPKNAEVPGGAGVSFDWSILKDKKFKKPWMLSGGLDKDNVQEALSLLSPDGVDVSSGVESSRGMKDPQKIEAFIKAAKKS